ncbi:copper amine oxidase N-terminal domain-containing protein [Desulforamulus ruminis]|uniref:Copper amine oxidase-like domain-containing protein n=1 Tax=Desulforamulus ruminis (strain ATCC 23193 / DSM 2154 / NCIMB 8452 / DL) TaxID=696281 RepID=F6DQK9_DESRL|nr:copper amine oxidase N-terminal domain-containing protein [Desulforamulus ruminis]AEG60903.1 copper amine oxidase-like domain-containing protein [Desulforamulus ruminis DSM 2154]
MRISHKVIIGILSAAILSLSPVGAFAADTAGVQPANEVRAIQPISNQLDTESRINFHSFSGTVKEVKPYTGADGTAVEGWQYVLTENEQGAQTNFLVTTDTYWVTDTKASVGDKITGFYDANSPALMIYPPQYKAEVMAANLPEGQNIKVDWFDENLISEDNGLKLNLSDKTELVWQNGNSFDGKLTGGKLVVLYDVTTKSIPAQTNPIKVIVLLEKAQEPTEKEKTAPAESVPTMDIVVNDQIIDAPAPYVKEDGTVMVPMRTIAEALGFEVTWNSEKQGVLLDNHITLTLGQDYYTYLETAPVKLGAAPEVIGGKTFVPLQFFKKVVPMNNAYVFEGQIVINNGEIME